MNSKQLSAAKTLSARFVLCVLLAIFLLSARMSFAQALSGISGTVTDTTGAIVPGAKVTITNNSTGIVTHAVASSSGTFRITDVNPGDYNVRVDSTGFNSFVLNGLHVDVGTVETANATLQVGSGAETVQVNASAIALETTQPELGTVIEEKLVQELPVELGGRDRQIDNFMFLAPGVSGGTFSHRIDGGVDFQNEVVFNGIPAVQSETQGMQTNINPPFEMISQFSVLQNVFPAQYGLAQGVAQYQFATGTNKLHADAFEILRNNFFDAKGANPQLDSNGNPVVANDKENNYGFSVSGPVMIPKLYDGRNKTFFYTSADFYRFNQGITSPISVPTQAMISGNFAGFPQHIYVPSSGLIAGCDPGALPGHEFPGDVIPTSCISTVSKTLLSLIPTPQRSSFQNNLNSQITAAKTVQNNWGFNIDHHLTSKQSLHFTFWRDSFTSPAFDHPGYFNNVLSAEKNEPRVGTGIYGTYTNTITPNLVVTGGIGWLGEINNELNAHIGYSFPAVAGSRILPTINFSGVNSPTAWGVNSGGEINSTNRKLGIAIVNNWLYTHGRHTINFGGEVRRSYQDDDECQSCGGQFTFQNITTSNGDTNSTDALNESNTGSSFASYLLGDADNASRSFAVENRLRNLYFAPYVQDDIKVNAKLTVNVGVRWDIAVPFVDDTSSTIVFFNPNAPDTAAINPTTGSPLGGGVSLLGTCAQCVGYNRASIHWREFSPRLGAAYQLNNKTSFLAGLSLNHLDSGAFEYGNNKVAVDNGNDLAGLFNVPSSGTNVPAYGNWDTRTMPVPVATPFTSGLLNGQGITYGFNKNAGGLPYVMNYNAGIQRELPGNLLLSVSYVGNKVLHAPSLLNNPNQLHLELLNQLCPNNAANCVLGQAWTSPQAQAVLQSMGYGSAGGYFTPYANFINDYGSQTNLGQALRPYPQYGSVYNNFENSGIAVYNALQAQAQKRFTNGLTYLVSYTLSKSMSNTDSGFASFNGGALNTYDQKAEYTIASNDQTHLIAVSGVYELPIGPGKPFLHSSNAANRLIIGGWQVSGIFQYQSGTPLSIGANGCPLESTNYICNRANIVPGQPLNVNWNNYYKGLPIYNLAAFSDPGQFAVGDAPRNIAALRSPWSSNENVALAKHLNFTGRFSGELRMEYYNILNRVTICNSVDNNVSDAGSTFGIDNSGSACQANSPRQGQATFKLQF